MTVHAKDLTTVANVLGYLKDVPNPSAEALTLIQRVITSSSFFIQNHLNRVFAPTSYTEYRNGTGGVTMVCGDYPVTAVGSVIVSSQAIAASTPESQAPGYVFDDISITLLGGMRFWKGVKNVCLTYTAGFDAVPYDVEQVCIDLVCRKWKERDRIGMNSKTLGQGETITFAKTDLTDEFKSLLRQYQKVVPV